MYFLKVTHMLLAAAKPQRKKPRRVECTYMGKAGEQEKKISGGIKKKLNLSANGTQTSCRLIDIYPCLQVYMCPCLILPREDYSVYICIAGQYDSDTPTGFTDDDDDHHQGTTKRGPVTEETILAQQIAKNTGAIRLQNLKERRRRGELVTYLLRSLVQ